MCSNPFSKEVVCPVEKNKFQPDHMDTKEMKYSIFPTSFCRELLILPQTSCFYSILWENMWAPRLKRTCQSQFLVFETSEKLIVSLLYLTLTSPQRNENISFESQSGRPGQKQFYINSYFWGIFLWPPTLKWT